MVSPGRAASSSSTSGATTVTEAPAARRPSTLRRATRPPPTTRTGLPVRFSWTGYWPGSAGIGVGVGVAGGALLVEAEDLQLDREVDLAEADAVGDVEDGGGEVQDAAHAGGDEAVGDVLGDVGGR